MAAGISIFTLMGNILIDNEKANESISKTEEKAESLGGKLMKGMGTAAKWGAAIGGAAIAGGTALFGMATKASDAGDRIDKMSQKIGVSSTAFQELDYVLGQNGADVDILQKGFQTLTGIMDKTADGTNKNKTALDTLGISVMDVNGKMKSQEEVFNESVKALMAMDEGVERSTLASELFGKKVASELVPMLNSGVESYEELTSKAHELGFVMDEESVKAAAAFNDSMDDIKKAMGGAITKIGIELMPMFQSVMDWIMNHMPEIQEVVRVVFEYIGIFVMAVVDIFTKHLLPILQSIFNWTKENWPTIQKIIEGVFKAIEFVWNNVLSPVLGLLWEIFKNIVGFVADNFPAMQKIAETVFENIGKAVKLVTGIFETLTKGIKTAYDWLTSWNKTDVKDKTPKESVTKNSGYSLQRPAYNAKGTDNFDGGWSWVGEEGPELRRFPKGTQILSNEKSMAMLNANQTVNHTGTIRVEGVNNKNEFVGVVEMVMDQLRREVRMA